jgi:hypothetical protein
MLHDADDYGAKFYVQPAGVVDDADRVQMEELQVLKKIKNLQPVRQGSIKMMERFIGLTCSLSNKFEAGVISASVRSPEKSSTCGKALQGWWARLASLSRGAHPEFWRLVVDI